MTVPVQPKSTAERMPLLFLGHGNPLYAIRESLFTDGFRAVAKELPRPKAILCISAHWSTRGTFVTMMDHPRTIHDFGGFPKSLYDVQYPAPGSPSLAQRVQQLVSVAKVEASYDWGLDHGCWAVLKYLYPEADVPVVEMSIDYTRSASFHYALGKELSALRREGVLIVASGNTIHNLHLLDWDKMLVPGVAFSWASRADAEIRRLILSADHRPLIEYPDQGREMQLSVPTPEHFLPLLYILSMQESDENAEIFNDEIVGGSLSMLSVLIR